MPAKSKSQQQLMAADLQRARKGQTTKTGMSTSELEKLAGTPRRGLPERVKPKKQGKAKTGRRQK